MHWWNSLFRKRAVEKQLDSELRFHMEELTQKNIAAGLAPAEARRRAILEFGGHEQLKEDLRDVHRVPILDSALVNFRWALRFLRKSPSFSVVVILTLALGIGANSSVFSAIDAILLRPLPFPNGDQLMRLSQSHMRVQNSMPFVAPVRLEDWNRMNSTFQSMAGFYAENNSEISGTLPERVRQAFVSPRFLRVLGVSPALGRDFSPEEEHFGGPMAVLISDRFWHRRFNASPDVVGKSLRINEYSWPIVGVMPASFAFPSREVDVWTPVPLDGPYVSSRTNTWYRVIGRLKPGVTLEQARADFAAVQAQLGKAYPETDGDLAVEIEPLKEETVGGVRSSLWILFGSVSLLLLIACTNIVALLLARAAQRQHEIAVRFSLGASRSAVVMQLLTEAFLLAFFGAAVGLLLAGATSNVFRSIATDLPRIDEIHLDARVVLYSLACAVAATLLCGLFPAMRATQGNLSGSLAQTDRTQVSGRNRLQWLLVGTQVALAVTLLAGAALLLRSFQALGRVSPGFDPRRVLTFHISASYAETADWQGLTQRIDRTVDTLRNIPGIEAAAASAELPGVPNQYPTELKFAEGPQDPKHKIIADSRFVSPGYFETMRIPLLSGEMCRESQSKLTDNPSGPPSARRTEFTTVNVMVNRSFVDAYLGSKTAIGRHVVLVGLSFLGPDHAGEIRGIVGDAREEGLNRQPGPAVYWCFGAPGGPDPYYAVRTRTEPMTMAETIRRKIHEIEPNRSVFAITPLEQLIDDSFAENRLRTILLTFFAITAVSLACIGLYGTLSYSVSVRQREIGLRLALGAIRGQIVTQFLLQGVLVTAVGCAAGWALTAASGRLLAEMLYGVSATDIATTVSVGVLVLLVAAAASLIPSIRAARLDPMRVLREE